MRLDVIPHVAKPEEVACTPQESVIPCILIFLPRMPILPTEAKVESETRNGCPKPFL
jgi:hypothetical protein